MQIVWSMTNGSPTRPFLRSSSLALAGGLPTLPEMQLTGQFLAQRPHVMQSAGSMVKVSRSRQTPAGHFFSRTWASYSSRKYRSVESTGFGAVLPRRAEGRCLHRVRDVLQQRQVVRSRLARADLVQDFVHALVCPRGRACTCRRTRSAGSSGSSGRRPPCRLSSSMTIMPPEPIMEPASVRRSKSTGRSRCSVGMQPPRGAAGLDGLEGLVPADARRRCRR